MSYAWPSRPSLSIANAPSRIFGGGASRVECWLAGGIMALRIIGARDEKASSYFARFCRRVGAGTLCAHSGRKRHRCRAALCPLLPKYSVPSAASEKIKTCSTSHLFIGFISAHRRIHQARPLPRLASTSSLERAAARRARRGAASTCYPAQRRGLQLGEETRRVSLRGAVRQMSCRQSP